MGNMGNSSKPAGNAQNNAKVIDISARARKPAEFGQKKDPQPAKPINAISADKVIERIWDSATGWNDDVRKTLRVPGDAAGQAPEKPLYIYKGEFSIVYSTDSSPVITEELFGPNADEALKDVPAYAISIFQRTSTTYLILVDMERRIIVREPIESLHHFENPALPWANVVSSINAALKVAESASARSDGAIAIADEGAAIPVVPKRSV